MNERRIAWLQVVGNFGLVAGLVQRLDEILVEQSGDRAVYFRELRKRIGQ